ncbi:MAG: DUF2784 domain-containing protein [Acidobacteriota bacterium]|nr:DUF2784 domain-containing protein [Acidobacteriota bacterium]
MNLHRLLADAVVLVHLGFVLWVVFGGLAVLRWPRVAWLHLPAAAWGALVELAGWYCPLTDIENALRRRAGAAGYEGGFVEHYLLPVLYPRGLTREVQIALGVGVIVLNLAVYTWILWRRKRSGGGSSQPGGKQLGDNQPGDNS